MTLGVPHMGWNKVTFPIIQSESLSIAIRYPQYIRVRADDRIKTLGLIELRFVGWAVTNTSGERQVVASHATVCFFVCRCSVGHKATFGYIDPSGYNLLLC